MMAVINHVHLSELEDEVRFDSQYYMPENMLYEEEIKAFPTIYLGTVALITDGQHGYFKLDENSEIRQITAKCIKEGLVDKTNADRLSHITHHNNLRSSLTVNDVLVTTAGTIGQIGLVTEEIPPANIDQDIGRIAIKNSDVSPYFIWAFLQSKFGRFQIERFTTGQVQTHLSLKKMKKLRIPLLSNHAEVEKIVKRFVESKAAAKELYAQAQHLLESELGLDKLSFQKPMGYTARFSELEQSRRLDPEHFYPAFLHLATQMPDHINLVPLGTQLSFCQRGKQPVYSANGLPVINSKHVQSNKIVFGSNRKAAPNPIADLQIRYGDLLMNGTGRGTLGRAAPYLTGGKAIPDNHVTILRSPSLDPAYLSFYLNSQAGQLQVEMHQRGTSGQLELYPFDIRKFLVWVAPESFQQEIRNLYDRAAKSEQKSQELLDQAKTRVEQLIEEASEEKRGKL
jgi:type I restriction enzyme M protein